MGYDMFRLWPATVEHHLTKFLKGGTVGIDATPALLGVGYIIGPRIAALMLAGAVMGYLGIAPLLSWVGDQIPGQIIAPGTIPLNEMDPVQLRGSYIKYLGVGAVSVGGFISLLKSFPVIVSSFSKGFGQLLGKQVSDGDTPRTDRDIPMKWVLLGVVGIILAIWLMPWTHMDLLPVALSVIFGFLFVVVAARIVGIVGSSSSPVSGMTIATLLVACLILVYFGAEGVAGMVAAMSVGTVVCIAVCMSGDIAQDLKTGYLLGATPAKQQLTEFIGLLFPALAMGFVIYYLGDAFGYVADAEHPEPLLAPQANVMATVVRGVMNFDLPWEPILVGGVLALGIELLGIQSLPVAIGLYLPLSLSTPLMIGGAVSLLVKKMTRKEDYSRKNLKGVLFASGLVAGDGLIGVIVAFLVGSWGAYRTFYNEHGDMMASLTSGFGPWVALIAFGLMTFILARITMRAIRK
jgi:putative OPT family oligopeptide transporter